MSGIEIPVRPSTTRPRTRGVSAAPEIAGSDNATPAAAPRRRNSRRSKLAIGPPVSRLLDGRTDARLRLRRALHFSRAHAPLELDVVIDVRRGLVLVLEDVERV